jgi:RNA polymerase sigma-70 factor, ECF subfamily
MPIDADTFETHRSALLALAYRMLGDMGRAEDVVQEAWIRWHQRQADVDTPKAFLLTTVTHLCLDELGSARARREESRSNRLPEPVDLNESGLGQVEMRDRISMAFLVVLQRLTPAERAVLLLHDVFEMSHAEIATRLGKTEAACRKLLGRGRENVSAERRAFDSSPEDHRRLLLAFVRAVNDGKQEPLAELLADDAVMIVDAGPDGGRFGRMRNAPGPVVGLRKITALLRGLANQDVPGLEAHERMLNAEHAVVVWRDDQPFSAIFVAVAEARITHIFVHIDPRRLRRVGPRA